MEEAGYPIEPVPLGKDLASAVLALDLASSLLDIARERFLRGDYHGSLEQSRDAIRVASSAMLFKDGYISASFESTLNYFLKNYPGAFPLDEWRGLETAYTQYGLFSMIMKALRKEKKAGEDEASAAIAAASAFINSARARMGP